MLRLPSLLRRLPPLVLAVSLISTGAIGPIGAGRPDVRSSEIDLGLATRRPGWSAPVRTPHGTELLGFQWDNGAGAVEVRVRHDGMWSSWTEVHGNPDEGPDPGSAEHRPTVAAGPVWVGRGVRDLEVRVTEGDLRHLRIQAIQSPADAAPRFGPAPASAVPSQPGIISRAEWGADESWRTHASGCDGSVAYASQLRNAFVHHTDNVNTYSAEDAAALVRGVYHFHTHSRGWCDIGYNFLVDRFGRIYEGRYGGVTKAVIGAHTGGFNTGATGASLIGNHSAAPPSAGARDALVRLLAWKLGYHSVDPRRTVRVTSGGSSKYASGTVVTLPVIAGHRDASLTDCPGGYLYGSLDSLRIQVQNAQVAAPAYPLPGWQPAATGPALLTLDAYGGLRPVGSQPAISSGAHWSGNRIARDVIRSGAGGAYVLDGFGGVHSAGGAPAALGGPYFGWDIGRAIARGPGNGIYELDGFGGIHALNGAPPVLGAPYFGWDIGRDLATNASGTGGYALDGFGGLHRFGTSPPAAGPYWGWDIGRSIALRPDGAGGYVLDGFGGIHAFGGAPTMTSPLYAPGQDIARQLVLNTEGTGGWLIDANGDVWPFGSAEVVRPSLTYTGSNLGRSGVVMAD